MGCPWGVGLSAHFHPEHFHVGGRFCVPFFFIMFQIFGLLIWPSLAILIWGFFENLHIIFPKKGGGAVWKISRQREVK